MEVASATRSSFRAGKSLVGANWWARDAKWHGGLRHPRRDVAIALDSPVPQEALERAHRRTRAGRVLAMGHPQVSPECLPVADQPVAVSADGQGRVGNATDLAVDGAHQRGRAGDVLAMGNSEVVEARGVGNQAEAVAVVVDLMGVQAPKGLLAIHTNMPGIFPADIDGAAFSGAPAPSGLSDDEKVAYERLQFVGGRWIPESWRSGTCRLFARTSRPFPGCLATCFRSASAGTDGAAAHPQAGLAPGVRRAPETAASRTEASGGVLPEAFWIGSLNKVRRDFVTRPTQNRGFAPLKPCRIGPCESGRAVRCFVLRSALGRQDSARPAA